MYRTITLLLLATTCSLTGAAQKKQPDTVRKYIDRRLAFTNKANMEFAALAMRQGDHWLLVAFYPDTSALLRTWFADASLTIKDGPFAFYYPGKIKGAAGSYVNNIKQGVWQSWHRNGQPKDSGAYKNNFLTGQWHSWDDSGRLKSIYTYLDTALITNMALGSTHPRERRPSIMAGDTSIGIRHGEAWEYYPNGRLRENGQYSQDKRVDTWTYWYRNGKPESKGPYVNDIKEGTWEYYHETGALSTRERYVNNKVASLECYNEQGNPTGHACAILKPPVPLGKFMDFDKYALDNMFWPEQLKRVDIQGDVKIEYTISREGELKDIRVLRSPHVLMSEEVLRFFRTLKWSPAVSHNRPIEYTLRYTVPFYR